eukprot:3931875-Rhodomonas_salina.5
MSLRGSYAMRGTDLVMLLFPQGTAPLPAEQALIGVSVDASLSLFTSDGYQSVSAFNGQNPAPVRRRCGTSNVRCDVRS